MPNYLLNLAGVFGYPTAENPAVPMMEAAFEEAKLKWKYLAIEVRPEDLPNAVCGLRGINNIKGVNISMPHKTEVIKYLDEIVTDAKLMGAVNLIRKEGTKLIGENTDGKGFMRSLREDTGINPEGKNVVLLGAGGAARAIGVELALAGIKRIHIVNRTEGRGRELAALINNNSSSKAEYVKWDRKYFLPEGTDILVNGTSIGLSPDIDSRPDIDYDGIHKAVVVCDVVPYPPRTLFLQEAELRGAKTLDGLGMLVYQGAIGFKMWTGMDASVEEMKNALKRTLNLT